MGGTITARHRHRLPKRTWARPRSFLSFTHICISLFFSAIVLVHGKVDDPARFVDPFIGTSEGGHVFAGATRPHGSVKPVADTSKPRHNQAGFVSDGSSIRGIGSLHDDGTGGASSLGNYMVLPMTCSFPDNCQRDIKLRTIDQRKDLPENMTQAASASPGFFGIMLDNGVDVRTTVTERVILHHFDYARFLKRKQAGGASGSSGSVIDITSQDPVLLFDLLSDLDRGSARSNLELQTVKAKEGNWSTVTARAQGVFRPSFGDGDYNLYACLTVPGVVESRLYESNNLKAASETKLSGVSQSAGALFKISEEYLQRQDSSAAGGSSAVAPMRIGISWSSLDKACAFAETDIHDYEKVKDFDAIKDDSRRIWNDYLQTFDLDITGVEEDHVINFYSSLYRTFMSPTNVTGDNPLWQSDEPSWDDFYCIWDSFRTVHPLYAILVPHVQAEIVRSLIDIWRHEHFLPDCRMSFCKGFTQGGSNADTLLADSYVKGIRDGINWTDGLQAMLDDAENTPPAWNYEGRGAIQERKHHGYIPIEDGGASRRSLRDADDTLQRRLWNVMRGKTVSRHLEYAYNDASIALVAAGEGKMDLYEDFKNRSGDWRNIWHPNLTADGQMGFFQGRYRDGSWGDQSPSKCSPREGLGCYTFDPSAYTYEASLHQYSFYAPADMAALRDLMGGHETFIKRLDYIWDHGLADIGDELSFLDVFAYNWALGGYRHTVDRQLMLLDTYFNTTTVGIPGNDDSGATGALVVFFSFGFMPVAGTAIYLLSTPLFPSYSITSGITGKKATVITHNFDQAKTNKYIVNATLNGVEWTKNWIEHTFFIGGGVLELWLGAEPSLNFGTKLEDLPPSFSTTGLSAQDYGGKCPPAYCSTLYPDRQFLYLQGGAILNPVFVGGFLVLIAALGFYSRRMHEDQRKEMKSLLQRMEENREGTIRLEGR